MAVIKKNILQTATEKPFGKININKNKKQT